jgi:hypothetical protein
MKQLFLLSTLFWASISCKKDPLIAQINTNLPEISGNWKLLSASGGFGGGTLSQEHGTLDLKLSGLYYSDILNFKNEGTYKINYNPGTPVIYYSSEYKISFDNDPFQYFVLLNHDSLKLSFAGNDGIDYVFVRQ